MNKFREKIAQQEAEIFAGTQYQEQPDLAIQALCRLIKTCTQHKDFQSAERLRDRLYEVNSMALTEVIACNELIEKAKTEALNSQAVACWQPLQAALGHALFNELYHDLTRQCYPAGHLLQAQGIINNTLFFIEQGVVNLQYSPSPSNPQALVKTLGPGDIIGENFFNLSLTTLSLLVQSSEAEILTLNRDRFLLRSQQLPTLSPQLMRYYQQAEDSTTLLCQSELERRRYQRHRLKLAVKVRLPGYKGEVGERGFRADLSQLSQGGAVFLVRISKTEEGRRLLGQSLALLLTTLPLNRQGQLVSLPGRVVAVNCADPLSSDFAIHIAFPQPLSEKAVSQLCQAGGHPIKAVNTD